MQMLFNIFNVQVVAAAMCVVAAVGVVYRTLHHFV